MQNHAKGRRANAKMKARAMRNDQGRMTVDVRLDLTFEEWSLIMDMAAHVISQSETLRGQPTDEILGEVLTAEIRAHLAPLLAVRPAWRAPYIPSWQTWRGGAVTTVYHADLDDYPTDEECGEYLVPETGQRVRLCDWHVQVCEVSGLPAREWLAPALECEQCQKDSDERIAEYEAHRAAALAAVARGEVNADELPF